jgi:ISXO2-like transposase domain
MVASRKQSISALQLQKDCGIGSYESAWTLLHRIRQTLEEREDAPLRGRHVEVYEPIIEHGDGVRPASPHHRQTVVGMAIERWRGRDPHTTKAGRIRMWPHISDIHVTFAFIERVLGQTEPKQAGGLLARTIAANLTAWLNGTFHGVSDKYMFAYVREFVFRFNRRRRERILPALVASELLRAKPVLTAELKNPTELEYPLSAA